MDGIYTSLGVKEWLDGAKSIVKEYDYALVDAAASADVALFSAAAQNEDLPANGTGLTTTAKTVLETSSKVKGQFATANWKATHLGLEIQATSPYDGTATNDIDALTILQLIMAVGRMWFEMYFEAGNEPHDQGRYVDFPTGYGLTIQGQARTQTESGILAGAAVCNGEPSQDALKPMRRPYSCVVETRPRMLIKFPRGAISATNDFGVRATVYGYK